MGGDYLASPDSVMVNTAPIVGVFKPLSAEEVDRRLLTVPAFFVVDSEGKMVTSQGKGSFFLEKAGADAVLKKGEEGWSVRFAPLSDVYFPVLAKVVPLAPISVNSPPIVRDTTATYQLVPSPSQVAQANAQGSEWREGDAPGSNVPVFTIDRLALKTQSNKAQLPFYFSKNDLLASWEKLRAKDPSLPSSPTVQVLSLGQAVTSMRSGSIDGATIQFYPSSTALQEANAIYQQSPFSLLKGF